MCGLIVQSGQSHLLIYLCIFNIRYLNLNLSPQVWQAKKEAAKVPGQAAKLRL